MKKDAPEAYAREARHMLRELDGKQQAPGNVLTVEERWREEQAVRLAQAWATLAVYERLGLATFALRVIAVIVLAMFIIVGIRL